MEMDDIDRVHRELFAEVKKLFGEPVKMYREFNMARNDWEWTIFARLFGRSTRFDVGLNQEEASNSMAVYKLVADLADQIIWAHERDLKDGFYRPIFSLDREVRDPDHPSTIFPEITNGD